MLTLFSTQSDFKKKLTVVIIWLVAFSLSYPLVILFQADDISFITKTILMIVGVFMIIGILLRCKIARALTIITLYILALYPLLSNLFLGTSTILFSSETNGVFSVPEAFLTNLVWAILFAIPLYFLSNNKSMDIFYMESNPKEHLFFIGIAIFLITFYSYFMT